MLDRDLRRVINGIINSTKTKDVDATMQYVNELEEMVGEETALIIFERLEAMLNA